MDLSTTIIIFFWLATCLFSLKTNPDIFSPTKFFLLFLTVFHLDIVLNDYPLEHELVVIIYIAIAAVLSLQEIDGKKNLRLPNLNYKSLRSHTLFPLSFATGLIWAFTIPALIAQIYFISASGGIVELVNNLTNRADEWRGSGPILMIIKTIMVIQVIYFIIGVIWKVKNTFWWIIFFTHLLVTLTIAYLSGSRSTMLFNFVVMLVFSHFFIKRQSILRVSIIAILLLSIAAGLAVVREIVKLESAKNSNLPHFVFKELTIGEVNPYKRDSAKMFKYGLIPLNFVFSREPQRLQNGLSLITPVTNIIPRKLWPNKPDTASIAMNKDFIGDRGAGPYQYPTGIIGFGVMNFGWEIGVAFGFALFWCLMTMAVNFYRKILNEPIKLSLENALTVLILIYSMISVSSLMIGEFANILVHFGLAQLLPILAFMKICSFVGEFFYANHKKNNRN